MSEKKKPVKTDRAKTPGKPDQEHGFGADTGEYAVVGYPATFAVHAPLPKDHPFYAVVGRIASEWSHIEHILDMIIWELARIDPQAGACITSAIMGVGPRCRVILTLGAMRGLKEATLKRFKTLMSNSFGVAELRARVVHDPWYIEKSSEQPAQFKAMSYSDKRYGLQDITLAELEDTTAKIQKLQTTASKLRATVLDELAALPKKRV